MCRIARYIYMVLLLLEREVVQKTNVNDVYYHQRIKCIKIKLTSSGGSLGSWVDEERS